MNKKKSPLKAADPVLVKGAYEAAGGALYQQYVQQHHEAMMRISKQLSSWDFGTGAQRIIDSKGRLPQGELNNVRDFLGGQMKDDYINGDNAKKEELTNQVAKMHSDMEQYGTLRESIANNFKGDNFSKGWMRTPMGQETLDLMRDKTRLKPKVCPEGVDDCDDKGSLGVYMTDHKKIAAAQSHIANVKRQINNMENLYRTGGTYYDGTDLDALYEELQEFEEFVESKPKKWTSVSEIQNGIVMVDQSAIELLGQARSAAYQRGKKVLPEDEVNFNRESAKQVVEETILGPGNMMSLVYDPMFGKTSYFDNLVADIKGNKYADYGITNDEMRFGDLDQDGIINEQEAQLIAQEFVGTDLGNNKALYNSMSEYLVNHLEKNYNLGVADNRESYIPQTQKEREFISGDRDSDGNYIPISQREGTYTDSGGASGYNPFSTESETYESEVEYKDDRTEEEKEFQKQRREKHLAEQKRLREEELEKQKNEEE